MSSLKIAVALLGLAIGLQSFSAGAASCDPMHGINLPHALGGGKVALEERWPYLSKDGKHTIEAELAAVRAQGFNTVRIVIDAAPLLGSDDNSSFLEGLHTFSAAVDDAGLCADYSLALPSWNARFSEQTMLGNPEQVERYEAVMLALLKSVRDPHGRRRYIETINEPNIGCKKPDDHWPEIQAGLYRRLRAAAPDVGIVVSATCWSSLDELVKFDPSPYLHDPDVWFAFHFYEPSAFVEQGLTKRCPIPELRAVPYPAGADCLAKALAPTLAAVDAAAKGDADRTACERSAEWVVTNYCRSEGSRKWLEARIEPSAAWAKSHGVAPSRIFVGEFGTTRYGIVGEAGGAWPDRLRWIADVRSIVQSHGFSWAAWSLDAGFALQCEGAAPESGVCPDARKALGLAGNSSKAPN